MSVKKIIEGLALRKAPGPRPSFSIFDAVKVLELISEAGSIGRGKIAEKTGLGEGAARTVISRLTDEGLIVTSKSGCSLTKKGEETWKEIKAVMPRKVELEKNELTLAAYNVAVLIKDRGEKVRKGLEQRDAAVTTGAKGAVTLVFKNNKLVFPSISADLLKDYPIAFSQITSLMKLEENDVVIISSADRLREAEYGVLAAAWTIF